MSPAKDEHNCTYNLDNPDDQRSLFALHTKVLCLLIAILASCSSGEPTPHLPAPALVHKSGFMIPKPSKLPDLNAKEPFYQILMFEGEIPMWVILDQNVASDSNPSFDLLYVDFNADGDLTQENERLVARYIQKPKGSGDDGDQFLSIWTPESLTHPGTKVRQTEVEFSWTCQADGSKPQFSFGFDCQPNRGFSVAEIADMLDITESEVGDPKSWVNQRAFGKDTESPTTRTKIIDDATVSLIGDHRSWPITMKASIRRSWNCKLSRNEINDVAVRFVAHEPSSGNLTTLDIDYLPAGEVIDMKITYTSKSGQTKVAYQQIKERC